jgi:hypothetical protein
MRFAVIALAFVVAVAVLTSRNTHVAPNPGPSGTPGSTVLDGKPPAAEDPQRQPQERRANCVATFAAAATSQLSAADVEQAWIAAQGAEGA